MTGARLRLAIGTLGVAFGVYDIVFAFRRAETLTTPPGVHVAIGWSFLGAGLVAWVRRPDNRTGLLLTLTAIAWFGRDLDWWNAALPAHASEL